MKKGGKQHGNTGCPTVYKMIAKQETFKTKGCRKNTYANEGKVFQITFQADNQGPVSFCQHVV